MWVERRRCGSVRTSSHSTLLRRLDLFPLTGIPGHDWGCGAVWSLASHYPEKCLAVAGLTVPYRVLELGLEEILKYGVNRDIYPADEFPFAQWDYMHFYETNFKEAHTFFESNTPAFLKVGYSRGNPAGYGQRALTATGTFCIAQGATSFRWLCPDGVQRL